MKICPSCQGHFPADGLFCPNDGSRLLPITEMGSVPGGGNHGQAKDPYLGREILEHIEIKELVGIGAMGRVYRAFQKGIDRDVAVKILHRELSANPQLVGRFLREAKVASRLQHPNVVHVLLSGQLPDGALYIVMEYLNGESLHAALTGDTGIFDLARALHVTLQLCDAVGEAHVQGIVHRDLKPENVMLVRRGQDADFVKVLDFGIARLNWSEQSMATATGLIFGTARYISPEGAQGEKVGPPGDVYSIATLLYQMLAGRTPFEGQQAVGLLIQQIHEPPPPLRSHHAAREVPPAIADVVMRGLAKAPAERPDGARAFGRALVDAARASGVAADDYYARSLFASPSTTGRAAAPRSDPALPALAANVTPHAPSQSTRDVNEVPLAAPTAKWTPPAAVQAQLAAIKQERKDARPRESQPSVDPTLDDDDVQPGMRARTDFATPSPTLVSPTNGTVRLASSPVLLPSSDRAGPTGTVPLKNDDEEVVRARATIADGRGRDTARASAPSAADVPTVPPAEPRDVRRRMPTLAIVVLCFFVGVGGALALHRAGALQKLGGGGHVITAPFEEHAARIEAAMREERWDAPPGENVRELFAVGFAKWPAEPRLVALRGRATDALVKRAVAEKQAREIAKAARLAALASALAPENPTTRALADEYAHELEAVAPPLATVVPAPPTLATGKGPTASVATNAAKVVLDTSPAKARLGQPVQFVAKVQAKGAITDGVFLVLAAGQAQGTRLVPMSDGATFRTAFTFLEAGRYEISFTAKADGSVVRTAKTLAIDAATPEAAPSASPAGSVKWL